MNCPTSIALSMCVFGALVAACGSNAAKPGPVSNSTSCAVVNADQAAGDHADITDYLNSGLQVRSDAIGIEAEGNMDLQELPVFVAECSANPSELASVARDKAVASPDTNVPLPTPCLPMIGTCPTAP